MMTVEDIRGEVVALSSDDLRTVVDLALAEFRRRRSEDNRKKAILMRPGQRVRFVGEGSVRLPSGTMGHVRKVNQRTVCVDFGIHGANWRVDASLLEAASSLG